MNTDVAVVADPSAAAPAVADGWDEHGTPIVTKKPEPPKKEEPAASDPPKVAKPEEGAEPGAAKQEAKPKAKPPAEERIQEVIAERKAAEARAERAEARARELEAKSTTPAKPEPAKATEPPKRPNPFTWTGTQEDFDKAMDAYEKHRDEQTAARTRSEQAQAENLKRMAEIRNQTIARHPDAGDKLDLAVNEITTKAPPLIQLFVADSDVIGELMYTLADADTLNNLLETAKTQPGKALRVLRDMELEIQKTLSTPVTKKSEDKPEDKAPENKPRAPKPPSEVGGRGAATEDADKSAARDGNFGAFDAEQRRKHFRAS